MDKSNQGRNEIVKVKHTFKRQSAVVLHVHGTVTSQEKLQRFGTYVLVINV